MLYALSNQENELNHNPQLESVHEKKNVLIVDDSAVMRKMVISAMSGFDDFNFIQAEDGVDALEKTKKHTVDLIILDYNMPRMNGVEFMKELRSNKDNKSIPIVMLTTENEEQKMINGYVAGARVYLTKPFKPEELIKVVETIRYWHMN